MDTIYVGERMYVQCKVCRKSTLIAVSTCKCMVMPVHKEEWEWPSQWYFLIPMGIAAVITAAVL